MELGLDKFQVHLDKLARLSRGLRAALFGGVVFLVFGVYGWFLYMPASQELQKAEQEHLQLQRKLSEVRAVAANEQAVRDEIAALEKKLAVALRQLPDSKELPVLLTDVTSLGKNSGLEFRAFRPQQEVRKAFYAEVPIDIEFTGGFHDIATFVDQLARLPRIVNISELEMTIKKETSTSTLLSVQGKATTFRFVEPEPEAKPDPKAKAKGRGPQRAQPAAKGRGAAQGGA